MAVQGYVKSFPNSSFKLKKYELASFSNFDCLRSISDNHTCMLFIYHRVGNICTYVSNDRMTTALEKVGGIVENNLDDLDTFLNVTVEVGKLQLFCLRNFIKIY